MKTRMGVWIDRQKAVITRIYDRGEDVQFVESNVAERGFNDEQLNSFYENVISKIREAEMVHIFGPSDTKSGLIRRMKNSGLGALIPPSEAGMQLAGI